MTHAGGGNSEGGATHVFLPAFTPSGALATRADQQVTDTLLVPTMIQMLVDSPVSAAGKVLKRELRAQLTSPAAV